MPKPTQKDTELLLQVLELTNDEESRNAYRWFWEEFDVGGYRRFKKKYPSGSEGSRFFNRFMATGRCSPP